MYWRTLIGLWTISEWISSDDFVRATRSPKFTSRISDLRKKGIVIEDRWVINKTTGKRHKEYKLITPMVKLIEIMNRKVAA